MAGNLLIIRNAKICEGNKQVDVLIRNGVIVGVYPPKLIAKNGEEIDASGCFVVPGGIDPHIHSRFPGGEHKEDIISLRKAAWRSGTTTVFDMPNTNPPMTDRLRLLVKAACLEGGGLDFRYWFGSDGYNLEEMARLAKEKDVVGVKLYLASKDLPGSDETVLRKIFKKCAESGLIVAVHAENKEIIDKNKSSLKNPAPADHSLIRSEEAEISEVERVIRLAKEMRVSVYFCHLSTPEAIKAVARAKKEGFLFYIEVCPHHLFLDDSYLKDGFGGLGPGYYMVIPPLRNRRTSDELINLVSQGYVDVIGSDHAPHAKQEKEAKDYDGIPNGLPGIDFRIPLMWQLVARGRITPQRFSELISGNAARIFGLKDRGEIAAGKKADLFLLDPSKKWKIAGTSSKCGWTPYEGIELQGDVFMTVKNGEIVYDGR